MLPVGDDGEGDDVVPVGWGGALGPDPVHLQIGHFLVKKEPGAQNSGID